MSRPRVVVVTRRTGRKTLFIDYVAELHLALLVRLKTLPVLVPVVAGSAPNVPDYAKDMSGLLLVEGEDIEPKRYAARRENFEYLEKTHPLKDEIEINLIRHALRRKLPILGICRGSQLLNIVSGGTLYGDVQKEKNSPLKHIDHTNYHPHRHPISIVEGTPLRRWYGRNSLPVTSYHHQGVRELAKRFRPMAYAEDGLIEGFYDPKTDFLVGLQFHPERMPEEPEGNWRIWQAFGAAVRRAQKRKS